MTINNQRPGVYSSYDISSTYSVPMSEKYAAVIAKGNGGSPNTVYEFKTYRDACNVFTADSDGVFMRSIIQTLFESGVSTVYAVAVSDDYELALNMLDGAQNIGAIVCDTQAIDDITTLKLKVLDYSSKQHECLGICGIDDPEAAIQAARTINCERIVITSPKVTHRTSGLVSSVFSAAAFAGAILSTSDAATNFNGAEFALLSACDALSESTIQEMLKAGVMAFESVGGVIECIRAVTTRTQTNNIPDRSLTGINAILIIDDVMTTIRAKLKGVLRGGRISGSPLDTIRSQTVVVLSDKQNDGLIEAFSAPRCYPDDTDPTVCVVEISFNVAHVISQIHVTAHIQV